jgi:hypothetical protein
LVIAGFGSRFAAVAGAVDALTVWLVLLTGPARFCHLPAQHADHACGTGCLPVYCRVCAHGWTTAAAVAAFATDDNVALLPRGLVLLSAWFGWFISRILRCHLPCSSC